MKQLLYFTGMNLPYRRKIELIRITPLLLLFLCLNIDSSLLAQTNHTIGTGTTTNSSTGNPTPYNDYYEGDRQQFLYRASELTAAGMSAGLIYEIRWNVDVTNNSNPQGWSMYIGTTTANVLTAAFQATPSTLVYGPASTGFMPAAGVNAYTLSTPFYWDGTSNILIQTCHGVGTGYRGYTRNASVAYSNAGFNACTYRQQDGVGSLCASNTNGTVTANRPNVTFTWKAQVANDAAAQVIVEPADGFCAGTYTVKARIANNGSNTINNVDVRWTVDGTAGTPVTWSSPINTIGSGLGNTAVVTLGNVTFGTAPRSIKAYTYLPNGVADGAPTDDTVSVVKGAALSGTYTIGGLSPDFPDVVTAAGILNQFGVCGPVEFKIRPGTYNQGTVVLNNIPGASATNTVTFQSESSINTSVSIVSGGQTFSLQNSSHIRIKDLTIQTTGLAYALSMFGSVSDNKISGCKVSAPISTSVASAAFVATALSGTNSDIEFTGNTFDGGYYGFIWDGNPSSYTPGLLVENNKMTGYYYLGAYFYYTNGVKVLNNTVTGTPTSYYDMYSAYAEKTPQFIGNRINNNYGYALLMDYVSGTSTSDKGIIANNVVTMIGGADNYGAIYINYPNSVKMYNNTAYATGSYSSCYTFGLYMSSGYSNNEIYNNLAVNTGGGYAVYIYNQGTNNIIDYNNWYTSAATNGYYYNTTQKDFATFRTASGQDKNSLTYDPQINNDGSPNPNNSACWSLNGRGLHLAGNDKDINGRTRVTLRADGVPDIGAFEFVPESVPPLATVTPAVADPGTTQVFTFGGNEIGRVTWGLNALTAPLEVRQYSGEKGTGIAAAASPFGSMYFHTDIATLGPGSTFDFETEIRYMDIWLGDISNESNLRMAQKVPSYQWMVYNDILSNTNVATNIITASSLTNYGSFTGLENGSILSAFVKPLDKTIICIGGSAVLNAEPLNGDFYKWYRNGVEIIGASGANSTSYTATQQGNYSVEITYSGKTVESVPVTVSTIAAPNAIIKASGNLTYCVGNGLMLDAGTATGVTYQWQLNGNNIIGATNSTYPVGQAGSYRVYVENIGCASVSHPTVVSAGPLNVDLGNDTSYCEIKNVFAKLDAGYPGAKYLWSTGDTTQTIEVKKSGKYTVQVDAGPNCVDNDEIVVNIDPLPKANGISFVQNGNTYQFFPSGAVGAVGYMWIFSDGTTTTVDNPVRTITGDLYVRLVMFNSCGTDTVQLGWPLSVESIAEENSMTIYPNPAKDKVNIVLNGADLQSVEVLNSVGSVARRISVSGNKCSIDVAGMPNGHYVIRASTSSGIITKQFDILR